MKNNRDRILSYLRKMERSQKEEYVGLTTGELAEALEVQRCNISTQLNRLVSDGLVEKKGTRPVFYRLKTNKAAADTSAFSCLAGGEGSLKNAVQLAKAAVLYPEAPLKTLLYGPSGAGKSYFVSLMHLFSQDMGIARKGSSLKEINCRYYVENESALRRALEDDAGQDLFINHIHVLTGRSQEVLFHYIEQAWQGQKQMIVCAADCENHGTVQESISARFPVKIEIPALAERGLTERFGLIKSFFMEEARKMGRSIKLNSEVLYCLMLYQCSGNVKQLRNDIRMGCANAYVRELHSSVQELHVYVYDFPGVIRTGLLNWKHRRRELEQIIPRDFSFSFSDADMDRWANNPGIGSSEINIYSLIEKKEEELRRQGVSEEEISAIVSSDLEYDLRQFQSAVAENHLDREALQKLVDSRIIALTDRFLEMAGKALGRVWPDSVFYGLCLHLSAFLEGKGETRQISKEKAAEVMETCRQEYELSRSLASQVEREFQVSLPPGELVIIAMFISRREPYKEGKPVVLIAMHGTGAASSICGVVNALSSVQNTYAFDFPLDMNMESAYQLFVEKLRSIDRGKGVIMFHDVGSMRTIAELAEQETGIPIRCLELPVTLLALECSRKAGSGDDLDEVWGELQDSCRNAFPFLKDSYQRLGNEKVIVTLCMTGQGGAVRLKNYIEKKVELQGVKVIPLSASDEGHLLREVDAILGKHDILCVVGTYDPRLHNIPFVSISKLFETPVDKLPLLLSVGGVETAFEMDYEAIYEYLKEQLPDLNTDRLRRHLPRVISRVKKASGGLNEDQELGLFMHLACSVSRLQSGDEIGANRRKDKIIGGNKRLYNDLKDILKPLEDAFHIEYGDNEIASLIEIIRRV